MTMWIIMGVLVSLIAIFLIVMAIKDKMQLKKQKEETKKLEAKQKESIKNVLVFLEEIYLYNEQLLKDFQPSIGKIKMGDIKIKIKIILTKFSVSNIFTHAKKLEENAKIVAILEKMKKQTPTTWNKKLQNEMLLIKKEIKKLDAKFVKAQRVEFKKIVKGYLK